MYFYLSEPSDKESNIKESKMAWSKNKEETIGMLPMAEDVEDDEETDYEIYGRPSHR